MPIHYGGNNSGPKDLLEAKWTGVLGSSGQKGLEIIKSTQIPDIMKTKNKKYLGF